MRNFLAFVFYYFTINITLTQAQIREIPLFINGNDGYACYRIPALVKTHSGSVFAFAEGRKQNCHDFGDVDIVYKTSTDNGKNWSSLKLLVDNDSLQAGNPGPVLVETEYNKIPRLFLFYNTGIASEHQTRQGNGLREVWFMYSDDNGKNWSSGINITHSVHKPLRSDIDPRLHYQEDWRSYAITPGHALQLKVGEYAGRIVVPANHSVGSPQERFDEYRAHCFYSDDGGRSFQLSSSVDIPSSNEAIAVELKDGTLMMNIREQSGREKKRLVSLSEDGGATWSKTYYDEALISPVCQASILSYQLNCGTEVLLFSNPESDNKRHRMTVKLSFDQGQTWPVKRLIREEDSAYSDLVQQQDNRIGLLYEHGNQGGIHYAHFDIEYLFSNHSDMLELLECP